MNCLITISDMHLTNGETDRSELVTNAVIEGDEAFYTVNYDEQSQEMKGCKTCIRVTDGKCVEIIRQGSYNTAMKIEKGKRNVCCYATPVGNISMGICASHVSSDFAENRLKRLEFAYELDVDGSLLSKNRIRITAE